MKIDTKSRKPLFEFSILLAVALMAYALWQLHDLEAQDNHEHEQLAGLQQEIQRQWQVMTNLESAFRGELKELQIGRFRALDARQPALRCKREYSLVGDKLASGIKEVQEAVTAKIRGGGVMAEVSARAESKLKELEAWISQERQRIDADQLQSNSVELMQSMQQTAPSATNNPMIKIGLGTLLEQISIMFPLYQTNALFVLKNADAPRVRDSVAQHGTKAEKFASQLLDYAKGAQANAQAIQRFLDDQAESTANVRVQNQEKAINGFLDTRTELAAFMRANLARMTESRSSFKGAQYALVATMIGLLFFLAIAIYRGFVVDPMRMERVTKAKLDRFEQLAAGLAHEIKQPLTAISARIFTLQKGLPKSSEEYEDSAVIKEEIQRLNLITNEFLKLARPPEPRLLPLSAGPLLTEVKELLAPECAEKGIKLECEAAVNGAQFRADPQQLKQVLINLVNNAAESIVRDGKITLRARKGDGRLNGGKAAVVMLEVEDNGPGMSDEVRDRLFDPFYSTKEYGTGLGLPIARRIIEKHGGDLQFETQLGRGALFRILLPMYQEKADHG